MRALRWLLVVAPLLAACVPESSIKPVDQPAALEADRVVLVGKVELHPALRPGEQKLGDSYREFADEALLVVDAGPRPVYEFSRGDLKSRIDAPFGKLFYVQAPAEPFYILKGWVVMNAEVKVMGPNEIPPDPAAPLEGMFRVDVRPGDKAVYIGTIQYYRDEFFSTEKVVVKDDYAAASKEFQKRFGGLTLRKSLAAPVSQDE
ncbi:MAG TPA: hypothetical protein VHP13_12280 [Gammaproteobacteria bacterium]|nr:hypothetical protein [Gammaproteobacteria bacterium]